jgi:Cytochrome c3
VRGARNSAWWLAKKFTFPVRSVVTGALLGVVLSLFVSSAALAVTTTTLAVTTNTTAPSLGQQEEQDAADLTDRCLTCHAEENLGVVDSGGKAKNLYIASQPYKDSAHGLLPCNACHTGFTHDPHQMVSNGEFFAQTAGEACRNCHDDQFEMYKQSYHGELTRGGTAAGKAAPECIDCHGTHAIQKVGSLKFKQSIPDVCGKCHGGRESTFLDTYHGKAITLGREAVATCVDCHGDHSILPVGNPQSTLSTANILGTCQRCHPKATQGFTTFLVHIKPTSPKAPLIVFLVAVFYLSMIVVVFLFGGIHTLLYIYRGLKDGLYFGKGGGH